MSECVREMTSKELIEQSSLSNKELILQRLKSENDKVNSIIGNLEKTVTEQRNLIESYRTVLKDMVYSNWLKWQFKVKFRGDKIYDWEICYMRTWNDR